MLLTDNSVKIWQNLPISNPKPDLHNINAHTKFGENPLMVTQVIIRKRKTDRRADVHTEGWAQDYSNSNIFLKPLFRGNLDPFVNNANLGAIAHTSNGT